MYQLQCYAPVKAVIISYFQFSQYFQGFFTTVYSYSLYDLQSKSEYTYCLPREVATILMTSELSENLIEISTENYLSHAFFTSSHFSSHFIIQFVQACQMA